MFFKKKKLSEIEFTKKFADALLKRVDGLEVISLNVLEIKTQFEGSSDYKHFLDNCYSEYLNYPKDIKQIFEKYLAGAETLYRPDEPIRIDRIFPIIKDQRFVDGLKKINPDFESTHVYEIYNAELYIFYAEDTEYTINYVSKDKLEEIDFPITEIREKSIQNLAENLSIEKHGNDGCFVLTAGGCYEASIILLDIWDKEDFAVDGHIVVGIPTRDFIIIVGSNDSKNLHKAYDAVKEFNTTGSHIVSDKLFEYKNGRFEVL